MLFTMKYKTIFQVIAALLFCFLLFYIVIVPEPVKYLLLKTNKPIQLYDADPLYAIHINTDTGTIVTKVEDGDVTFYRSSSKIDDSNTNLVVWFNGGAFLTTDRRASFGTINCLMQKGHNNTDIVTFDYPTRFKYTVQQSLLHAQKIAQLFFKTRHYKSVHAIGMSAGVMLAGAFQMNEINNDANKKMKLPRTGIRFQSIVTLCGLMMPNFQDRYLNAAFKFYMMRGTPGAEFYTCENITTPMYVVSADSEYLYSQSFRFIQSNSDVRHDLFSNASYLKHTFPLEIEYNETQRVIDNIIDFQNSI